MFLLVAQRRVERFSAGLASIACQGQPKRRSNDLFGSARISARSEQIGRVRTRNSPFGARAARPEHLLSDRSRNGVNGSIRALQRARRCTAVPGHGAHPAILSVASWHGEGAPIKHDSRHIAVGKRLASRGFGEEPGAGEQERSSGVIVLRRDGPGPALRMGR